MRLITRFYGSIHSSSNNIHNSENCVTVCCTVVRVSQKPQSKFRPIPLQRNQIETLSFFFAVMLARTFILQKSYLNLCVLAAFYKFHWTSKGRSRHVCGGKVHKHATAKGVWGHAPPELF